MRQIRLIIATLLVLVPMAAHAGPNVIDFETISSGVIVRDEFLAEGLKITGVGGFSGRVQSTGDFGVGDFGNSQTQWVHMGQRNEATTLTFVDPADSSVILGATAFSVRVGDGNADTESFSFTYFDVFGNQLDSSLFFTTLGDGLTVSAASLDLGALIGSVVMNLLPNSDSGATFDDVTFTLAGGPGCEDSDDDTINDSMDNCILIANFDQRDTNGDGYGNACDPDLDNNGIVNFGDVALWVPFFNTVTNGDADFNGDGFANFGDYALYVTYFLQPPGPSGVAP